MSEDMEEDSSDKVRRNLLVYSSVIVASISLGITPSMLIKRLLGDEINVGSDIGTVWLVLLLVLIYLFFRFWNDVEANKRKQIFLGYFKNGSGDAAKQIVQEVLEQCVLTQKLPRMANLVKEPVASSLGVEVLQDSFSRTLGAALDDGFWRKHFQCEYTHSRIRVEVYGAARNSDNRNCWVCPAKVTVLDVGWKERFPEEFSVFVKIGWVRLFLGMARRLFAIFVSEGALTFLLPSFMAATAAIVCSIHVVLGK
ncbi:hypothetical protein Q9Q94_10265 [Uliginosibacterium sp. 31-16]|uniref:hypothetical protein n=1 Tax=Uliginosibacterium sp. 31-16 TaxID=3068315 RepID=UPI00273F3ACB|nr:hypothetical protein [Uliginosibacterium sp. 31-16]MDP5239919.1 hypothetical protein [Uliginosibacterium sp. 31-16]